MVLWILISGHVMQILCWNELQGHKSRAEVHWTFDSWCIADIMDQTALLILLIRETLKYTGKSFVQKKQWQKLQGSWVKHKLYLRTVFGCSCYLGDDLWDRRLKKQNAIHFYSCGLMWGEPSSQINVVMWWLNLMTWEIPVLEFLCNCNNDLFHYLLTCWLHGNLGYSIICYIETEQLDLFVSVKEGQNLSKF